MQGLRRVKGALAFISSLDAVRDLHYAPARVQAADISLAVL
jgi:hypothetical protein